MAQESTQSPVIGDGSVRNAADLSRSIVQDDLVFGSIARGSIFLLKGNHLGPEALELAQPPYPARLPDVDGGTRVEIRSLVNGQLFNAPLIHSWNFQVAAILPSAVPAGLAEIRVLRGELASKWVRFTVAETTPAVFTLSGRGFGPAAAQVYRSPGDTPLVTLTGPVRPGDTVTLWATGLGPIEGDDNAPPVGTLRDDVSIRFGDLEIIPDYAGRAPGQPGLDQINFRLPENAPLPNHCYVPFSVRSGDSRRANATLSLGAAAGPCRHPWNLPAEKLQALDEGGRVRVIHLQINRFDNLILGPTGIAEARMADANAAATALLSPDYSFPPPPWMTEFEGCATSLQRVGGFYPGIPGVLPPPQDPPDMAEFAVGEVRLLGPAGTDFLLARRDPLFTLFDEPVWIARVENDETFPSPGEWTFRVGAADGQAAIEQLVALPDLDALPQPETLQRGADHQLDWNGDAFDPSEWISLSFGPRELFSDPAWGFTCHVRASAGRLTIPAEILADIPEAVNASRWTAALDRAESDVVFEADGVDRAAYNYGLSVSGVTSIE